MIAVGDREIAAGLYHMGTQCKRHEIKLSQNTVRR
jgi:hypothetical protein